MAHLDGLVDHLGQSTHAVAHLARILVRHALARVGGLRRDLVERVALLPELAGQPELLHVIDFEGEIYMRQERGGVLLGTYERAGVPWSPRTTPWDFGQDLLPNDLERIAPSL